MKEEVPYPGGDEIPSPGGWEVPEGRRPGWDWVPPGGATHCLDEMPLWLRILYRTPVLDRRAYEMMWWRGGFRVLPPGHRWLDALHTETGSKTQ